MQSHAKAIVLRLRGGLGNQLFEYASARALSLRNRVPLYIDAQTGFAGDPYARSFELNHFNIAQDSISLSYMIGDPMHEDWLCKLLRVREQVRMRYFGRYFDPFAAGVRVRKTLLWMIYAQSPSYFDEIQDLIRSEFEFRQAPDGLDPALIAQLGSTNSVCLHLRRRRAYITDGSVLKAAALYGQCGVEYYSQALKHLSDKHGPLNVFIFSDDYDWARQNIQLFSVSGGTSQVIDETNTMRSFYLMRLCRHFIIANSSFSWWAAWLGRYPEKTVCAPPVWNYQEKRFPLDLFPKDWKLISS